MGEKKPTKKATNLLTTTNSATTKKVAKISNQKANLKTDIKNKDKSQTITPKKILMVSSEAYPFAKSGGLGDMVSSLSISLANLGHDVRIILPRYYNLDRSKFKKHDKPMAVPIGFGEEWVAIYETTLPNSKVIVYLIDHERLFGRDGIYGDSADSSFSDNMERFTLLSRACFMLCKYLSWIPDVMHSHDWPSSLVPLYLYSWYKFSEFYDTASVFTIHNLGYQGWASNSDAYFSQLDLNTFPGNTLINNGSLNLMQGAIKTADLITTVSPNYANEIMRSDYGCNLEEVIASRKADLFGVLNGIDEEEWNPEIDSYIAPNNFSVKDLSGKAKCKEFIQKMLDLEVNPDIPMLTMISRLADQKGIGALAGPSYGSLHSMCQNFKAQFVIMGTGEFWCEQELQELAKKNSNLKVLIRFDQKLSHQLEAAADFFIMPSKYEPCGLNQLYSLKYGTLPIVRRTGGLVDTVQNYDENGGGTGFMFNDLTPSAIYDTVAWAVYTYYNKRSDIKTMVKRAMEQDFSWKKSAHFYSELYQWARDRKLGNYPRSW